MSAISRISSAPMPRVVTAACAEPESARVPGAVGLVRNHVAVQGDAGGPQRGLGLASVQPEAADVDQHEVVVGAAGDHRHAAGDERLGEYPCVVDDRGA